MAIDYLIGTLIAASTLVNALALGAFWVTPGLRTTANRFVINLLIVNLVGCAALTPSLFGSWSTGGGQQSHQLQRSASDLGRTDAADWLTVEQTVDRAVSEATAMDIAASIGVDAGVQQQPQKVEEMDEEVQHVSEPTMVLWPQRDDLRWPDGTANVFWGNTRHWGFDLTAALGALSVLLIVGDTWCAVTDPLRYHARISGPKAWLAIALSWSLSVAFAIASAFRSDAAAAAAAEANATDDDADVIDRWPMRLPLLYDSAFAAAYFVLVVLTPICLVCGMYWKIVTEAKQNGLRMRQNGSSPLLQSALNLASTVASTASSSTGSNGCRTSNNCNGVGGGGGLVMSIDQKRPPPTDGDDDDERDVGQPPPIAHCQPLLRPQPTGSRRYLEIPRSAHDTNHNSLAVPIATLSTVAERGHLTRNLSTRHLQLLTANGDAAAVQRPSPPPQSAPAPPMRHVRSTPNLRKVDGAQHAVAMHTLQHHLHHQHQHHQHHSLHHHHHHHHHNGANHAVTVHVTPSKALCYMSSIRHRLSNASSIFKYREESRAARISVLVVVMYVVAYLPYGVLVLLDGLHVRPWPLVATQQAPLLAAVLLVMVSSIGSPVIFAYRNKRVRRGVWRLFGLDAKANERKLRRQLSGPHQQQQQRLSGPPSGASLHRLHVDGVPAAMKPLPPMAPVTVSIHRPPASTTSIAEEPPVNNNNDLAAIKQRLSLLRRVYRSTRRRFSCTGSTDSDASSSCGHAGAEAGASSHSSRSGSSSSSSSGGDGGGTDSRRQSSDV